MNERGVCGRWFLILLLLIQGQRAAAQDKEPTHDGKTVREWTAALKDKDSFTRYGAASALRKIALRDAKAVAPAVPALAELLKDANDQVQNAAAYALEAVGSEARAAIPALCAVWGKDNGREFRFAAACAMLRIGPSKEDFPAVLAVWKKEKDELVHERIGATLKKIDPEAAKKAGIR